jgi:hypothetical protein
MKKYDSPFVYSILVISIGTILNLISAISPSPINVFIIYVTGYLIFLGINQINISRIRKLFFLIIPLSIITLTCFSLIGYCQIWVNQKICQRNPIISSSFFVFFLLIYLIIHLIGKKRENGE